MTSLPKIIAHRGASFDAPENTMRAFSIAKAQGADSIEIDVQPSADNEVMIFHDWDLRRLCGVEGTVRGSVAEKLRPLRVNGEPLPTLCELLASDDRPRDLVIELKSRKWNDVRIAALTARVLRKLGKLDPDRITISSFNPLCLFMLRRLAPEIPRALLAGSQMAIPVRRLWGRAIVGASELHLQKDMVTRERILWAHRAGRRVVAWTVNDPEEGRELASRGVDGMITDVPEVLREALSR